jgi:uncharacterized protein
VKLQGLRARIHALDWQDLEAQLDSRGYAVTRPLLSEAECAEIGALYARADLFRKTVNMARQSYGAGEYRYFAEPVPEAVACIRETLYEPLAGIANRWAERLRTTERYPRTFSAYRNVCERNGQVHPTPLMLDYHEGGFNCLHQDVYGERAFPLQAAAMLSRPDVEFQGGEFLLVEQRPRMQSRGEAVVLEQGAFIVFPNQIRPVAGKRGHHRVKVRHGVSRVRGGHRRTLGIIFHDALK